MKLLISNDDGIHASGLEALIQALSEKYELVVFAPESNRSACSSALTLDRALRVKEIADNRFMVNGNPADCVHLALNGVLDKDPDHVVSGINHGANLGDDTLYSGTLAAAIEGRFLGRTSVAFSIASYDPLYLTDAAGLAADLLPEILSWNLADKAVVNVNIPDLPRAEIKGVKLTRLGHRLRTGQVHEVQDPKGGLAYWIGLAGNADDGGEGTDFHAIEQNYISITPLSVDLSCPESLDYLKEDIEKLNASLSI